MIENTTLKLPHAFFSYPIFFATSHPVSDFFFETTTKKGDQVKVSACQTPTPRELIVFLATLFLVQETWDEEKIREAEEKAQVGHPVQRIEQKIKLADLRRVAGFSSGKKDKQSLVDALRILSTLCLSVQIKESKKRKIPFSWLAVSGPLGDIAIQGGDVWLRPYAELVRLSDSESLRVSLTHVQAIRSYIGKIICFMMHGKKKWCPTWSELAGAVGIGGWSEEKKQKQALKKALMEMAQKGFVIEICRDFVSIRRNISLSKTLPDGAF